MDREFRLPDLGEGVHEGQILRLLIAEGAAVHEDQPLMEVETDKSAVEIPSPCTGAIVKWHVREGQAVRVGDVMVTFSGAGSGPAAAPARSQTAGAAPAAVAVREAPPSAPRRVAASPAVRTRARQLGVDLATVAGSGPGGRILLSDLDGAAAAPVRPSAPPPGPAAGRPVERAPSPASPPPRRGAPAAREPLSLLRKLTSRIMVESVRTIPHVTDCDDADVTDLDRLRRGFNDDPSRDPAHDAPKLGLLPFVVAAVARALRRHPVFNAGLDVEREEIVYHDRIGIAIGVQTERGLVAPVLRDPDRRSIRELAVEIDRITAKCRAGRFESADAEGATYTISNAGAMGGSRYSTPIITPPQVAVLAVGRSRLMPWVVDGRVEPRLVMPLSHSMDHRIVDGAQEIAFMRDVIGDLERPARLLL